MEELKYNGTVCDDYTKQLEELKRTAKDRNTVCVYGVPLSSLQEMNFSKYMSNNHQTIPRPNTISKEQRKELVLNWLNSEV